MSKKYDIPAAVGASYLTMNARLINWVYGLQDNRVGRRFNEIGVIPFEKIDNQIYYNMKDLELVAEEFKLHELFDKPFTKLFD